MLVVTFLPLFSPIDYEFHCTPRQCDNERINHSILGTPAFDLDSYMYQNACLDIEWLPK